MKKAQVFTVLALMVGFALTVLFYLEKKDKAVESKKYYSGKELRQQEVERKLKRRAAGYAKPDKPSMFAKYHQSIRTLDGAEKPTYSPNYKMVELEKAKQNVFEFSAKKKAAPTTEMQWRELGPGNVSGRTRGLIIDPDDETQNTWITGSVSGGIWRTTNAGASWTNLTPDLPNLSTVCIAMAGSDHNTIYAGTGEGFYNTDAVRGAGILKSTDRGATWTQLNSTTSSYDFSYVNRLIVDPSNADVVVAVTNTGIFKTTDGGSSWNSKFSNGSRIQHIIYNLNDFNIQYAGSNGVGVLKSVDAGENWEVVLDKGNGRYELAISPNTPTTVYALNQESELFVSYNAGLSWSRTQITTGNTDKFLSGQGWYDNTIAVAPNNHKQVFIGGVNLYKVSVIGEGESQEIFYSAGTENISSFMQLINFGGNNLGGKLNLEIDSDVTIVPFEIRFGENKRQKAYRFTVPEGATNGVASSSYSYNDYVEVPFEVWDTENNRQLMVSFRDQDRNGVFNLTEYDDNAATGREYIFIHATSYNETPSNLITKTAGHTYKQMAFIWPVAQTNYTWDASVLPDSKIYLNKHVSVDQNLNSIKIADWAGRGAPYVHADNHNIQITERAGDPFRIVVANDGGVGYSDNGGASWSNPANGYNTTQFYGIDKHPTLDRYIGGTQDNGTWISPEDPTSLSNWTEATGGDGFDVVWHSTDPNKVIASIYYNRLYVSNNGGQRFTQLTSSDNLTDYGKGKAPFITQIANSTNAPNRLYLIGPSGVSRSVDFGETWNLAFVATNWGYNGQGQIAISEANPEIVWAGCGMSSGAAVQISTDGGASFVSTSRYSRSLGVISGLATHPTKPNTAFALFSIQGYAKILRTDDKGQTWTDISQFNNQGVSTNGFPDVAVYSLQVMPHNTDEIWVGTEIGLFISRDNGATWQYADNGLPAVSIWDIKIRGDEVVLGTHGRGVWTVTIPELANATRAPVILAAAINPERKGAIKYNYPSVYDSVHVISNNEIVKRITSDLQVVEDGVMTFDIGADVENISVQLKAFKAETEYLSKIVEINVGEVAQPVNTYANNFEGDNLSDFYGDGFSVTTNGALTGRAIHTQHPYVVNKDIFYTLKVPIEVTARASDGKAYIQYDDIPMIEPGEPNVVYGENFFLDYVVLQGSKDGIGWIDIGDGYDFNLIKTKALELDVANEWGIPVDGLYKRHKKDLLEYFEEGDIIFIRFKLHSGLRNAGWGWAIDNIEIQQQIFTSNKISKLSDVVIYPNPAKGKFNVKLGTNLEGVTNLSLWSLSGQLLQKKSITAGSRTLTWNVENLQPGNYILEVVNNKKRNNYKIQVVK